MAPDAQRLEYLVRQYAANNCTANELLELMHITGKAGNDDELQAALQALWQQASETDAVPLIDKEKIFESIVMPAPVYAIGKRIPWLRMAAAACIVLFATAGFYYWFNQAPVKEVVRQGTKPVTEPVAYTRHITLPDGSSVVLHAGSTIEYPQNFEGDTRAVTLKGEAYFDVAHQASKPFIIYTGMVRTTVLGTAFTVTAYPQSGEVTVAVSRGKVQVEDEKKVLAVLTQNEQVTYSIQQSLAKRQTVNAAALVTGWTRQDMLFDGVSFEAIAEVISKRYGITIEFKNAALKPCLIKASFSGTEQVEKVLEILTTIRGAAYVRQGDTHYVIDGQGCE